MKSETIAYIAGLFDGEGTITLSKIHGKGRAPVVSVSSTSYELLDHLKQTYGGSISTHKTYKEHHKKSWSWKISYDKAITFCSDILPYSKEKSKIRRMKLVVKFYKQLTPRNGKYTELILSKRGKFERIFFSS